MEQKIRKYFKLGGYLPLALEIKEVELKKKYQYIYIKKGGGGFLLHFFMQWIFDGSAWPGSELSSH